MLLVQVSCVAVDVYCDSHKNPAGLAKKYVVALVRICKTKARINHVEQIHRRSEVEYPRSVLLKALHLVHAYHCHKVCKGVKRPGTRVKESVKRNLLSQSKYATNSPRMNMTSTRQSKAYRLLQEFGKYFANVPTGWSSLKSSFCSSDKIPYNCSLHIMRS